MSVSAALLVIAVLLAAGTWVTVRLIPADRDLLPLHCRSRLRWWQLNARYLYAGCAVVTLCTVLAQL